MSQILAICLALGTAGAAGAQVLSSADLDALVAGAARYESGASAESLRPFDQWLAASAGDPALRASLEAALVRLLAPEATGEAKRFACSQLAVIGSEAAVPALTELLKQDATVGVACFALGRMTSAKAGDALSLALASAKGVALVQIVETLGHRADPASAPALAKLAGSGDVAVARAAIRALGALDCRAARAALAELRQQAKPEVAAEVAAASLRSAQQQVAAGNFAAAAIVCNELLRPGAPAHIRRGAVRLLLESDADGGLRRTQELIAAKPSDPVLTAAAIARLPGMRGDGVSKMFGALLPQAHAAEQILLIEALACRGDAEARAAICAQVGAGDPRLRCAAVAAMGRLEGDSAVAPLVGALSRAASPDEAKVIQLALAGLQGGEKTEQALCAALQQATGSGRLQLMTVLSLRGGPVAVAALLGYAAGAEQESARAAAQALVRVADTGGTASLTAVQSALAGGEAGVRAAALRALAAWRGFEAWDTLLGIWRASEGEEQRSLALRGLARMAGAGNAQPDAALVGRYRQLLEGARSDDERKRIASTLAGVARPDALALALPLLDLPGVRAEAAQAVERIALAIQKSHPKQAEEALAKVKGL